MGQPAEPTPSPAQAPTTIVDQHTLDAAHNQILILASGFFFFLVSQLVLVTWLFARPSTRRESAQRSVASAAPRGKSTLSLGFNDHDEGAEDQQVRQRVFRRSSTWNGRSRFAVEDSHLLLRRRMSSGFEVTDLRSSLSSSETDSDSSRRRSVRSGFQGMGMMAAALATPIVSQSPRRLRSPLGSIGTESDSSSGNEMIWDLGRLPSDVSPRPPRVVPIDQATISAILRGEMDRAEGAETPPVSLAVVEDGLVVGFDGPLGVNHHRAGLMAGDGRNGDGKPRERRRSDTF